MLGSPSLIFLFLLVLFTGRDWERNPEIEERESFKIKSMDFPRDEGIMSG